MSKRKYKKRFRFREDRLEKLLAQHGMTAGDLARILPGDQHTNHVKINVWRRKKVNPKPEAIYMIAQYFRVPMEYFIELIETAETPADPAPEVVRIFADGRRYEDSVRELIERISS